MSESTDERLYGLLPAIYRQRDAAQGQPLRALLLVMEAELRILEADVDSLYDNWFVETCAEWAVPYLGDLLGIRGLSTEGSLAVSQRSLVANTIGYRRRKGIAAILERVAQDVTGWGARAVEFFQLVGVTQHMQHVRPGRGATVDVRDRAALDQLGGPFEAVAHTVDTRRAAPFAVAAGADPRQSEARRGKHNVQSVGIFLWRVQSYALPDGLALAVGAGPPYARYTFHPLGQDTQLFNNPQPSAKPTQPAAAVNLPLPISRAALAADLQAYTVLYAPAPPPERPAASAFYGPGRSLWVVKDGNPVLPTAILAGDLSAWQAPSTGMLALDPQLGRLAFATGEEPAHGVTVSYSYGFSADIGGGTYDRRPSLAEPDPETWPATVATPNLGAATPTAGEQVFTTLRQALDDWAATGRPGLIQIADSGLYDEPLAPIELPDGGRLTIQAAAGVRPSLRPGGDLVVRGGAASILTLNGLLLDGGITVNGSLALNMTHCTLLPRGVTVGDGDPSALRVTITRSIVGALRLPAQAAGLTVQDSIVDGLAGAATASLAYAIAAAADDPTGPPATLAGTTLFGQVAVTELTASNVIFDGLLTVQRRQTGSLRFCSLPPMSQTPQRYRCQPDLALQEADMPAATTAERARAEQQVVTRLRPAFTSRRFGDPGYAQLSVDCALEIRGGADDGSEMGAFQQLHQRQREAGLRAALDEYLPAGLEAGTFSVT